KQWYWLLRSLQILWLQKMRSNLIFHRFCTTGLPSDIVVEVDAMSFHLHKTNQKKVDFSTIKSLNIKPKCLKCCAYVAKLDMLAEYGHSLIDDVRCLEDNAKQYLANELKYKSKLEEYKADIKSLTLKPTDINDIIDHMIDEMNNQTKKCKSIECSKNSQLILNNIVDNHVRNPGIHGIGYKAVPPPINYGFLPEVSNVVPFYSKSSKNLDLFSNELSNLSSFVSLKNAGSKIEDSGFKEVVCDVVNEECENVSGLGFDVNKKTDVTNLVDNNKNSEVLEIEDVDISDEVVVKESDIPRDRCCNGPLLSLSAESSSKTKVQDKCLSEDEQHSLIVHSKRCRKKKPNEPINLIDFISTAFTARTAASTHKFQPVKTVHCNQSVVTTSKFTFGKDHMTNNISKSKVFINQ
ncbi:hypothetical protein R6Q59_035754, partial [Mikania micrantha]